LVYWEKIHSTVKALPYQLEAQRFVMNVFIGFLPAVILGLLFALLNSGLHQAVLYWNGVSQNFLDGFLISFIGDITGAYIVFLLLKLLSKKFVKLDESETG
jgi:undecaprenyl pyrophosphate phosphatase UppP